MYVDGIHRRLAFVYTTRDPVYMSDAAEPSPGDGGGPPGATVTVKGPGVDIVRPVDEATLAQVIALLFGVAPSPGRTPGGGPGSVDAPSGGFAPSAGRGSTGSWDPELTLGEFLAETGASTFPQKICAAGYYLVHLQGAESFDRDSVRTALVQAHEDLPGNFARDFSNAAAANLIAQKPGGNGAYYVPTTGRRAVDSRFQDVPKRRARNSRKTAGKNDKSE